MGVLSKITHSSQAEEERDRKSNHQKNECLWDKFQQDELNISLSITQENTGQGDMHIN